MLSQKQKENVEVLKTMNDPKNSKVVLKNYVNQNLWKHQKTDGKGWFGAFKETEREGWGYEKPNTLFIEIEIETC